VAGWAFPNGLTNAGLAFGSAATGPLIAWLMVHLGWRQSFVVTAPLALVFAAVWWWYARDRPAEHPSVSQTELDLINRGRSAESLQPGEPRGWEKVIRNREILLLTASYFCSNYVFYFFFNWLFIYLVENRGFKTLEGGFSASAPWLTGCVGAVAGGVLCDRLSLRVGKRLGHRWLGMAGLALSGAMILAAAGAAAPLTAVLLLSLCLGFQQVTDSVFWSAAIALSGKHASSGSGVMNTAGNVVGGVVALVVPLTVRASGWPAALATGAALAFLGAVLWLWIRADREFSPSESPARS
jgi:ACS family glucarate transporter-like MFS transporter